MSLVDDYQHIAERSLSASDVTLAANLHEKAAFMAYHAFESTGCALAVHQGRKAGPRVTHPAKIDQFRLAAAPLGYGRPVAALAFTLSNLRNTCLYPTPNGPAGSYALPEKAVTPAQAREIRKRVGGMVRWVDTVIH